MGTPKKVLRVQDQFPITATAMEQLADDWWMCLTLEEKMVVIRFGVESGVLEKGVIKEVD